MAILRIRDDKGNITDIPAIKGEKGEKGDKGDKGDVSVWKKIVHITTAEEVNGIVVTAEEFPALASCKEFIMRVVFPKTATALTLGAMRISINNDIYAFRANSVSTNTSALAETRCHTIIADGLVHTVGTENSRGHNNIVGNAMILVGEHNIVSSIQTISTVLNDSTKLFPVGTKFIVYGKVEV